MDEIKRYRLLIGGAVLIAMGVLAWWAIKDRTGDTTTAEAADAPTLPEIERDAITEIEIRRPEDDAAIRLVKDGETWRLAAPVEAPAATSNVDTVLDKLADLDLRGVASTNPTFHERLEVDAEHGVHVIARAGDEELIDFWVGAFRGGNTMIRLEGEDQVLMVRGSIKFAFNKPVRDWRDRAIVELEADSVREATFTSTNGSYQFRKNGENWEQVLPEPAEGAEAPVPIERFSSTKVRTVVSSLARLRASDFAAADVTAETAGLGESAARAVFTSGEGEEAQTTTILVGNEVEEGSRYVMREGDPTIYVVSRFMAERLMPNTEAFQDPEPGAAGEEPPPDPHGGMPPGGGMPGGGQIPPELMQQIQRQLQQQGMGGGGGGGDPHGH